MPGWNRTRAPPGREPLYGWLTSVSVGVSTWFSWGKSDTNFRVGPVDVALDLFWRNLVSESEEISVCGVLCNKVVFNPEVGAGTISGGQFKDRDFAESGLQDLFSESISPSLNDDLLYVNVDVGWRFYEDSVFVFDGLVGYQFWRNPTTRPGEPRSSDCRGPGCCLRGFLFLPGR